MQVFSASVEAAGVDAPVTVEVGTGSAGEAPGAGSVGEGTIEGSTTWVGSGEGAALSVAVAAGVGGSVGWIVGWGVAWTGVATCWVGSGKGAGLGPQEEISRNTKNGSKVRAFGEDLLNIGFGCPLKLGLIWTLYSQIGDNTMRIIKITHLVGISVIWIKITAIEK